MQRGTFYINTIGCQMNVYDSDRIASQLRRMQYEDAAAFDGADIIILNTCTIREKAEQKAFSFLGRLAALKHKRPDIVIGVGGCVAQQKPEEIIKRMPWIDLVFGTHAVDRLPELIERVRTTGRQIVDTEFSATILQSAPEDRPEAQGPTGFVTIMRGCDNHCAYCVVPSVRGPEKSRAPEDILEEIQANVRHGMREVTLLGQNVNSYGKKEGLCSFPELLRRVDAIDGLWRIRFTTSHPKDLSPELIRAFADIEKLCRHLHLPVQAGSNEVLKRMNRKYTREIYLDKIDRLRRVCPDLALSTDIIVGFPGETEADFSATVKLLERVEYDSIFAFAYSDRPGVPSVGYPDKIPEDVKRERLKTVLDVQKAFTLKRNRRFIGDICPVLVEGLSKKTAQAAPADALETCPQFSGRTTHNKIVNFKQTDNCGASEGITIGQLIDVRIEKAFPHSLWGSPVPRTTSTPHLKGERIYAA